MESIFQAFKGINPSVEYAPETALSFAVACELAYRKKKEIQIITPQWGFPNFEFIEIKKGVDIDTQCYIMANQKDIVTVFCGTNNICDWLTNVQFLTEPGPLNKTRVHGGFQHALYPALLKLTDVLREFKDNGQRVWVTGHSLGGALASIYAGMLIENKRSVYGVYTIASPRPGNISFARELNREIQGPHYRIVNEGDIVPHFPPKPFGHCGKRMILRYNSRTESTEFWERLRKKALKGFVNKTHRSWRIKSNHNLVGRLGYISRLERNLDCERRVRY